ncbi:MAG: N-acetylglucosaminyldiphosphoundecaprenol N-acetyl-beta-D-mannosaminyltransferase [Thermotogaceae bacterium]|nr:N-acetylglucosaminyldiphosphoundecaprenol N-acetyl-beta-D-mannosaminyltransferase [Thermotogaceae bacterium]
MQREFLEGIKVLTATLNELVDMIFFDVDHPQKGLDRVYWGINPAYLYRGKRYYSEYIQVLRNSSRVYVDGFSILLLWNYFKRMHPKIPERVATTDLFPVILEKNRHLKKRIFLLGSEENVVRKVFDEFKSFGIVGYHNGYFRKEENDFIINCINQLKVDILFVGLGNPKQERWIIENIDRLQTRVIIPCGGLFDHYAKYRKAPDFFRKHGLEWIWRLWESRFSSYRLKQVRESILYVLSQLFSYRGWR